MNIENYFDFLSSDDIRVKGTRVGIETILYEYIHREQPPEAIVKRFTSLTLEQVYATILYYLQNKSRLENYLADWLTFGQKMRNRQAHNPPPVVVRLRCLKEQQEYQPSAAI